MYQRFQNKYLKCFPGADGRCLQRCNDVILFQRNKITEVQRERPVENLVEGRLIFHVYNAEIKPDIDVAMPEQICSRHKRWP
jgi:hypothetical protein